MARTYLPISPVLVSALVLATLHAFPSVAHADGPADADLRTFRPSTDRYGSLATEGIETPGPWNLQFTQWFTFDTASLRVANERGEQTRVLGPRLILDPAVQLGLGRRASIGATLPIVAYQDGSASSLTEGRAAPSQGIGDFALTGKASAIIPDPDAGGLGLAFLARMQLPTGDRTSFISDRGAIAEARALLSMDYAHLLVVTATAGYRMRFVHHSFTDVTIGDTIPWGATISLKPRGIGLDPNGHWTWSLEARGEIGAVPNKFFGNARVSPAFAGASVRYELDKSMSIFLGGEGGLNSAIGVPAFRAILGFTYAPTIIDDDHDGVADEIDDCPGLPEDGQGEHPRDGCPDYGGDQTDPGPPPEPEPAPAVPDVPPPAAAPADTDGDGIADDVDKCPDQAETKNGYEDEDGCPENDKDGDTFLDAVDHCPDQPETFNGVTDDDGCPDEAPKGAKGPKSLVTEVQDKAKVTYALVLARPITFDLEAPSKDSTMDLRAVAKWILEHPGARVRVAVKPDGKGDAATKVAETRANAIVSLLVRFAHTGNVAETATWDPKAKGNVQLTIAGVTPVLAPIAPPPTPKPGPGATPKPPAPKTPPAPKPAPPVGPLAPKPAPPVGPLAPKKP